MRINRIRLMNHILCCLDARAGSLAVKCSKGGIYEFDMMQELLIDKLKDLDSAIRQRSIS